MRLPEIPPRRPLQEKEEKSQALIDTRSSGTTRKGPEPGNVLIENSANLIPISVSLTGTGTAPPPPTITGLSPTSGAVGALVTITGTNFGVTQGISTVSFNGTTPTPTSWSATSITATVPSGATTGNVFVTVGGIASNGSSFTVVPAPTISSLSPNSGAAGTAVTITGANFGATQGTGTVTFNGTNATVTSWSATSISSSVPTGATTGPVVVFASGVNSNGVNFTVQGGGGGGIARVHSTAGQISGGSGSITIPSTTAGNLLVVQVALFSGGTQVSSVTDGGDTFILATNSRPSDGFVETWYCLKDDERLTTQLKLRPYLEWASCNGKLRPREVPPEFAQPVARGTITVFADPVANKDFPFPVKCDSPLFWKIAEPWLEGKYVCHHCVEVEDDREIIVRFVDRNGEVFSELKLSQPAVPEAPMVGKSDEETTPPGEPTGSLLVSLFTFLFGATASGEATKKYQKALQGSAGDEKPASEPKEGEPKCWIN